MIHFACPACAKVLKVKPELTGKKVKCPKCGQAALAPAGSASPVPASGSVAGSAPAEEKTLAPKDGPPREASEQPTLPPAESKTLAPRQKEETQFGKRPGPTHSEDSADDRSLTDFLAPPEQPDEIGRLGSYRILKVLGAGGMGVVFKAEDPGLQRLVAIKAMLPAIAASASARKRFLREARAAAGIKHNHIVTIFQVGEDRGVPFLAMEFLEGEPLDERLKREPTLPVAEAIRIGREMAEGLAAAHAKALIHRDIKPANTWLEGSHVRENAGDSDETRSRVRENAREVPATRGGSPRSHERGYVKILDFGLARSATDQTHLTQSGAIIGTPAYMAPEQAGGRPVDHRCDLFSLGCVLYRMCTGELPFKGNDTISILSAIALETPPPPDEVRAEVPAELSDLIMRLLAKNADDRPGTAQEVAESLLAIAEEHTESTRARPKKDRTARPRSRIRENAGDPRSRVRENAGEQPGARASTRILTNAATLSAPAAARRWLWPAGAAAFLVAAGLAAFLILGRGSPESEQYNKPPSNEKPAIVAQDDTPFDRLDANLIPASEKFSWQPKELVAVIGTGASYWRASGSVRRIAASPDGKWIVTGDDHSKLTFWDVSTRTQKFSLSTSGPTRGSAFLPDKFRVVASSGNNLILVDGTSGAPKVVPWPEEVKPADLQSPLGFGWENLQCSGDGTLLTGYGGGPNGDPEIRVWEMQTGAPRLRHRRKVKALSFPIFSLAPISCLAEDSKLLAYIDGNKSFLCDPTGPELKQLAVLAHKVPPAWLSLSRDGKNLAIGLQGANVCLYRWDGKTLAEWTQIDMAGSATFVQFSPNGARMFSGGPQGAQIWKLENDGPVRIGVPFLDNLRNFSAVLAGDGKTLVATYDEVYIRFWDIQGVQPKELDPPDFALAPEKSISVARNGLINYWVGERSHLWQAVGNEPRPLGVNWDIQTKPIMTLSPSGDLAAVWHKSLSRVQIMKRGSKAWDMVGDMGINLPQSPVFDTTDRAFYLVDKHPSAEHTKLRGLDLSVTPANEKDLAAIAPRDFNDPIRSDARWLVLRWSSYGCSLWDMKVTPPTSVKEWKDGYVSQTSPGGEFLATTGSPIRSWDLRGITIKELETGPANFKAHSLSFSPDGKTLAAAGEIDGVPGQLILFEVPSMKIKQQFTPFPGPIHSVHFADDRHLVTHNGNRTLYILRLAGK